MQFLDERGQAVEGLIHSAQLVGAATGQSQKELRYRVVCPVHCVRMMTEAEALAAMATAQGSASALQQFLTELRGPVRLSVFWCVWFRSSRAHCPSSSASVRAGQVATAIGLKPSNLDCAKSVIRLIDHDMRNPKKLKGKRLIKRPEFGAFASLIAAFGGNINKRSVTRVIEDGPPAAQRQRMATKVYMTTVPDATRIGRLRPGVHTESLIVVLTCPPFFDQRPNCAAAR
eukprot:SAG11_NODE_1037_length_6079_cov_2.278930_5_plen_230_part_00